MGKIKPLVWPLGFGLFWGVEHSFFSSSSYFRVYGFDRMHNDSFTLSLMFCTMLSYFITAAYSRTAKGRERLSDDHVRKTRFAISSSLLLGGVLLISLSPGPSQNSVFDIVTLVPILAGALIGIGAAEIMLSWQQQLLAEERPAWFHRLALGFLTGAIVSLLLKFISPPLASILSGVLIIVSSTLFLVYGKAPSITESTAPTSDRKALSVLAIPLLYCCLARALFTGGSQIGFIGRLGFADTMTLIQVAILIAAFGFWVLVYREPNLNLSFLLNVIFATLGVTLVVMPFVGTSYSIVFVPLAAAAASLAFVVLNVVAIDVVHQIRPNSIFVLGVANGFVRLAALSGIFISEYLFAGSLDVMRTILFALLALWLLSVVSAIVTHVLMKDAVVRQVGPTAEGLALAELDEKQIENLQVLANRLLSQACERLAEKYMLSIRETEVLFWLAKGSSIAKISEGLSISLNTVKTHTKMIYVKMDVHSRKELGDAIELEWTQEKVRGSSQGAATLSRHSDCRPDLSVSGSAGK